MTDTPRDSLEPVRDAILDAALPLVPFDGWTLDVLRRAASEAGIDRPTQLRALPRDVSDLIDLYALRCDGVMAARIAGLDLAAMKVRERITTAVRARIDAMTAHKDAAYKALHYLSSPAHAALGARLVARTSDRIWRAVGDTSTDVNFFTKRGILSGVYGSTVLVYFDDTSPDHAETWAFLDRRINDVMTFEKVKAKAKDTFSRLPSPLAGLAALRYPSGRKG